MTRFILQFRQKNTSFFLKNTTKNEIVRGRKAIRSEVIMNSRKILGFQTEKRHFLFSVLAFIGSLPFFNYFKPKQYKKAYFFVASLSGTYSPKKDNIGFMNKKFIDALNKKMKDQKKIVKKQDISLKNKSFWLYIFDSKESYLEWSKAFEKFPTIFSIENKPDHLAFSCKKGYLNSKTVTDLLT